MRYEIFPSGARWRWRLVHEDEQVLLAPRSVASVEECFRDVDAERRTTDAAVVVVEKKMVPALQRV